jgi:hypothetical protein
MKTLANIFLWPGTKLCEKIGVDPTADMGLMRSFFNFMIWLPVGLLVCVAFI